MNAIQKEIKSLAISYHAYIQAIHENDSNGIKVWGKSLLEAQENTGVEMIEPKNINRCIVLWRNG